MDFTDIRQLMQEFSDSPIGKLSLEWDALKITLEKQPPAIQPVAYSPMPMAAPSINVTATAASVSADDTFGEEDATKAKAGETAVRSPVVGIFYSAPSPGATPYVSVGQRVEKGQTLCIVEAMKMMNEIPAPVSGTVTRILMEPEATVEYDQPMMFIV